MTLAEKIEAVVREAFPCEREGEEACAYNFTEPMPGHDLMCPARFAYEALDACRRVANLAIEEAAIPAARAGLPELANEIRALALPEDKR